MINQRLKSIRKSHLLSQQRMSKLLNVSYYTYNKIEQNKTSGTISFWMSFQKQFQISNEDMWGIITNNKENEQ